MGSNPIAPSARPVLVGVGRIPLKDRRGQLKGWATVDLADFAKVVEYRWSLSSRGYACRQVRMKPGYNGQATLAMHRFVYSLGPGDAPGRQVDHINGDQLDNRRSNLRLVTPAENQQNRRGSRVDAQSTFRGVSYEKRTGKWRARAQINGRRFYLGEFDSENAAARAATLFRRDHMPGSLD